MRAYLTILRTSISERLVYRTDFFVSTALRFAPIITTILLWRAVFAGSGRSELEGFRYEDIVAYYLFTTLGRAFSSMPGLASGITRDVRQGQIQRFLLQPVDYVGYLLMYRVAHKLVYYTVAFVPFLVLFTLCRHFLPGWPEPERLVVGMLSLVFAFLLGFHLEASLGMLSFWFLEITGFLYIMMGINYFFSGHMIPLDLLPAVVRDIAMIMPFQYLAYFPATVWLGRVGRQEMWSGLAIQLLWVVLLVAVCRILLARGLRRYAAYGG